MRANQKLIMNHRDGERGAAMVIMLLVMTVLTGLGAVVFVIGTNNLQNAGKDRLAGGAQGAGEAGVAQGLTRIRTDGVGKLKCREQLPPTEPATWLDCDNNYGRNNPQTVTVTVSGGNQRVYKVWVEQVQPFAPSQGFKTGTYSIHSEGTTIPRPGKRTIEQKVSVSPLQFPIGIFGNTFTDPGSAQVLSESMFSKNCIGKRQLLNFSGEDPYNKIPAAAHSIKWITKALNTCLAGDPFNIHAPQPPFTNPGPCNAAGGPPGDIAEYKYDQDQLGAPFGPPPETSPCYDLAYPQIITSKLGPSEEDLVQYGYDTSKPKGLSESEYAALKSKAQEQGLYATNNGFCGASGTPPSCMPKVNASSPDNIVMFWDLATTGGSKTVQISGSDIQDYTEDTCGLRSVVIVVRDGNVDAKSNLNIVGAIFVPDADPVGQFQGAGGARILGTLFANKVNLNGNVTFTLKGPTGPPDKSDCFFENLPGGLIDVKPIRFREVDR